MHTAWGRPSASHQVSPLVTWSLRRHRGLPGRSRQVQNVWRSVGELSTLTWQAGRAPLAAALVGELLRVPRRSTPCCLPQWHSSTGGPGHPWHARQQHAPWYPWAEIGPKKPSLFNPRPHSPLQAAQEVDFQVFNIQPDAQQSGWEAVGQRDKISLCHRYWEQSFIPM